MVERGQTLIEIAIVLPLLALAIAVAVQLIIVCHNRVVLQMIAVQAAGQISAESSEMPGSLKNNPLWGKASPALIKRASQMVRGWKPFKGMASTVRTPAHLITVRVESKLSPPLGFGRLLPIVTQMGTAEAIVEPPRPPED